MVSPVNKSLGVRQITALTSFITMNLSSLSFDEQINKPLSTDNLEPALLMVTIWKLTQPHKAAKCAESLISTLPLILGYVFSFLNEILII